MIASTYAEYKSLHLKIDSRRLARLVMTADCSVCGGACCYRMDIAMQHKQNSLSLSRVVIICLLTVTFIGLPSCLAQSLWTHLALSPRMMPFWLNIWRGAGLISVILGVCLPMFMLQIGGMIAGFSLGVLLFSKFMSQQQMENWLFNGRLMSRYTLLVKRLIRAIYK